MKVKILILILFSLTISPNEVKEKTYSELISTIIKQKEQFKEQYNSVHFSKKDSILDAARNYLVDIISSEVLPHWYNTPWDFNGTTRTPKKGKIACGYFITNTLTDVGFQIPRIKWAQSASETFIKKLSFDRVKRFHNQSISKVKNYLKESGNGLYLVGLDNHVGYVFVKNNSQLFIHAGYYKPDIGVVSEKIDSYNPLLNSSYRIFGKLMSDDMVLNWINNVSFQ